jgi:ribosomal protein L7/L12
MAFRELRCPSCTAPVEASDAERTVCRYCGATLVAREPAAEQTETQFFVHLWVAPSNVDRVARLLTEQPEIDESEARALVAQSPGEIAIGTERDRAQRFARAAMEAGARAEVKSREVAIPVVDVVLDGVHGNKLAVIVAIREKLELSVSEAKRMVETAPSVVVSAMDERKARALVAALEAAGASMSMK